MEYLLITLESKKAMSLSLLYGHPESFLSDQGIKLVSSKIYQENVAAIVVDEAHCIEMW